MCAQVQLPETQCLKIPVLVRLILEQHEFELCASTYMQIFFFSRKHYYTAGVKVGLITGSDLGGVYRRATSKVIHRSFV